MRNQNLISSLCFNISYWFQSDRLNLVAELMMVQTGKVTILAFLNLVGVSLSPKHPYSSLVAESQRLTILLSHLTKPRLIIFSIPVIS